MSTPAAAKASFNFEGSLVWKRSRLFPPAWPEDCAEEKLVAVLLSMLEVLSPWMLLACWTNGFILLTGTDDDGTTGAEGIAGRIIGRDICSDCGTFVMLSDLMGWGV